MNGVIFDVKRFALHDGAGIRSTLFLKGCPLSCKWCQNPEGISFGALLLHGANRCLRCGGCVAACEQGALTLAQGGIRVDRSKCDCCGRCSSLCPSGAMEIVGRTVSASEAAALLLRDRVFFGDAGGVTLSGGEAFAQPEFALDVLARCKAAQVDTAVETCLYAPRAVIEAALPCVDHFLVDIKLLDAAAHLAATGVDNAPILDNYEFLVRSGADVLVRTPLIPGFTATSDNIRAIARYVARVSPGAPYELLNFNPLCRGKYDALAQAYPVLRGALTESELAPFYEILARETLRIVKES